MDIICPACESENTADSRFCHKCGIALELSASPTVTTTPTEDEAAAREALIFNPGDKFGERYTIIEEIGRGGMGRVYKAKDNELAMTIVLKMIRPELSSRPGMIDKFKEETRAGLKVTHKNVVRIHDLGVIDTVRYISMDYIKGQNLSELIRSLGSMTLSTCLRVAIQICNALKAIHNENIIHQDLKPQNIMIENSGNVFVTDFGLAKSLSISEIHRKRKISGTPKYFSPEQARGEESDPRSDIYSLGVILYEMFTGEPPFKADSAEGYIKKHISEKPSPPSTIKPSITPACEKIILKCLEKNREDRYQNVDELLKDLELQKKQILGEGPRPKKWPKIAVGVALIFLCGLGIWKLILSKPPPTIPPKIAIMYAVNDSGDKSLDDKYRWTIPYYLDQKLIQSKYLKILRQERLMSILTDMNKLEEERYNYDTLDKISEKENVDIFILPGFTISGDNVSINSSIRTAKTNVYLGEPDPVEGKKDGNLAKMVEELSDRIKRSLDLPQEQIEGDYNQSLENITTTSEAALDYFITAEKFYAQRNYEASIKALGLAVEEDPNFALAKLKLADNYYYLDDYRNHRKYLKDALELVDRVSVRDKYIIQGYASSILDESPKKAIESYEELIRRYPNDEEARILLAAIYRNFEEWDRALVQIDRIMDDNPENLLAKENKVFICTAQGLYEEAIELSKNGPNKAPEGTFFLRQIPLIYLIQGKFKQVEDKLEKAMKEMPENKEILELMGNLFHLKGDLLTAHDLYERIQRSGEADPRTLTFDGRKWLSRLMMQKGEYNEAHKVLLEGSDLAKTGGWILNEIDLGLQLAYLELQAREFSRAQETLKSVFEIIQINDIKELKPRALLFSGLASLGMGQIEDANEISKQLSKFLERASFPKGWRYYDLLIGHIELEEGRTDLAIRRFKDAIKLLPYQREIVDEHAFFQDSLARALYIAESWPQAIEAYQGIVDLTTGRLCWGDKYVKSYYWLGKIQQRYGNNTKAVDHFENFLRLWKDADDGIVEIIDAQKQLDALKKNS